MGNTPLRPILITGGGRRIGLALAHHFLNLRHPVIVSYRTEYPSIEGLRKAGAVCIQADSGLCGESESHHHGVARRDP